MAKITHCIIIFLFYHATHYLSIFCIIFTLRCVIFYDILNIGKEGQQLEFYKILQSIMEEKSMRISDVARVSGLSDSTVRSILTRHSKTVALDVAFKLSKGLGVTLECLNGSDTKPISSNYLLLSDQELDMVHKMRSFDEKNRRQVYKFVDDLDKDIKIAAILLQSERLQQAMAYGGKTASSILSEEQQKKLDELFKKLD